DDGFERLMTADLNVDTCHQRSERRRRFAPALRTLPGCKVGLTSPIPEMRGRQAPGRRGGRRADRQSLLEMTVVGLQLGNAALQCGEVNVVGGGGLFASRFRR